ncbi:MAG: flagellar motor protein [Candidatus Hydrogenedentes bacterium]|nr:flagellar motor protein [Candidatus Hydrogenedentota bacterium]
MEPMTIIGLVVGIGAIIGGALMEGAHISSLFAPSALMLIAGGTFGSTVTCYTLHQVLDCAKKTGLLIRKPGIEPREITDMFVQLATIARKEGILALENQKLKVDHPFLRRGLRLVIDGTNPELVKQIMMTEIYVEEEGIKTSSDVYKTAGGFSPTMGIIGTVIGLIHVLGNLSNPDSLGPSIAMAFIATLYGVAFANLVFLPISKKFATIAKEEAMSRTMIVEGVLSLYGGDSPHIVKQKLMSFMSEKSKTTAKAA